MGDLAGCMDSRVRAACSVNPSQFAEDARESSLHCTLNRGERLLQLPTVIGSAVIFNNGLEFGHLCAKEREGPLINADTRGSNQEKTV